MMKRFINILIAGLFLFTTTGFTITKHYCSGSLVEVSIDSTPKTCCGENGGGCCSNESELFQLKEDVTLIQAVDLDKSFYSDIQLSINEFVPLTSMVAVVSVSILKYNIPPPNLSAFLAEIQSFRL